MHLYGFASFDELLAFHCAPVLTGLKPANIISLQLEDADELESLLPQYNRAFAPRRLVFRRLRGGKKRTLVFIYDPAQLNELLHDRGYRSYLIAAGYAQQADLEGDLEQLEKRLADSPAFPHEIGVFLGYPLEDILGFVLNKGTGYKYSGYWRVYGDVPKARKLFAAYEQCRDFILQKLAEGLSLAAAAAAY